MNATDNGGIAQPTERAQAAQPAPVDTTAAETPVVDTEVVDTNAVDSAAIDISALRIEIDQLDAEILRLVKRRTEVSQAIGVVRMASGGTRIVVNREMDVLARYRDLGPDGRQLAMALLNLGRGRMGR